ncbi:MAG: dipeptide ABC transporter ATP-binding protein [Anaerolineales bacterium]|nr:MAG: dipeptide ABC transporter ATP-binding protein [Anaerolineales bacterium]
MIESRKGKREVLVRVENLKKHFPIVTGFLRRTTGQVRAVDGVSFEIFQGETLGLVGESGCGKSTLGRTLLQLHRPTAGQVFFEGLDLASLSKSELRSTRKRMQIIFQDPYSSLNPRMTIEKIIAEPLTIHNVANGKELRDMVEALLVRVGMNPLFANRFPHEFSGGQRQRIGVARALALNPAFIVADEPISALDVSIQAQVVNLLEDLQGELGHTYLFIAHDLSMVRHICDRVAVMYLGKLVEIGSVDEVYENPQHPYLQALLSAVPVPDPEVEQQRQRIILEGDVPSPANPPVGCNFNTRCPIAFARCFQEEPELKELIPQHQTACFAVEERLGLA